MYLRVLSEQKKDPHKEFIKHLLAHGGSYTDLFEKEQQELYTAKLI